MDGINKAINQKKFNSEFHKSIVSILYVSNLIKNQHFGIFKSNGITLQQFNILRILRGSFPEPCTIGILKERMMDKMSDASRLVDRLIKMNLVIRVESENDRRTVNVFISEQGLALLSQIDKYEKEFDRVVDCLSGSEILTLNNLLGKIIDENLANS